MILFPGCGHVWQRHEHPEPRGAQEGHDTSRLEHVDDWVPKRLVFHLEVECYREDQDRELRLHDYTEGLGEGDETCHEQLAQHHT